MPTVTLNAYSKSYPSITNRIQASISLTSAPSAIIASIIDSISGHPQRVWSFPGLNRANYDFMLSEINSSGDIINNLALFSVTPGELYGQVIRQEEQPKVNLTNGFTSGQSSFTFDGSETSLGSGLFKPDYRNWVIRPSELTGRGILVEGLDYSWNKITGLFQLLQSGDVFSESTYYNIYFEPQLNPAGNSVSTLNDFDFLLVTSSVSFSVSDFGKKVIIEPSSGYIELTLPFLNTLPQGRSMMVENSGSASCAKFLTRGSDTLNFLGGLLIILPNESFYIYKYTRPGIGDEYRVSNVDGNFKRVGESVSDDKISGVYNKKLMDGRDGDLLSEDARLYNQFILNLPITQVCNYDDWATGNNKYLYSLANSSNPANFGKFKFPDRRGIYERNNNIGKAGDYLSDDIKSHNHSSGYGPTRGRAKGNDFPELEINGTPGGLSNFNADQWTAKVGGDETRPKSYLINKYVLI